MGHEQTRANELLRFEAQRDLEKDDESFMVAPEALLARFAWDEGNTYDFCFFQKV